MAMMKLTIQDLREEYEVIDKVLNEGFEFDNVSARDVEHAYLALDSIIEKLILSSTAYHGMTSGMEITENLSLDMQYVVGRMSEPEMRQREDWHWKRCEEHKREETGEK